MSKGASHENHFEYLGAVRARVQSDHSAGSRSIPHAVSAKDANAYTCDCDGRRVKSLMGNETILFVGSHFEYTTISGEVTKYYFAGAARIAIRKYTVPVSMAVEFMNGDHLGSTSLTTDANGAKISEMRFKAYPYRVLRKGETRYSAAYPAAKRKDTWTNAPANISPTYALTKYQFTGQYSYAAEFGLHFYNARWYDSQLGRFAQADSIVPGGVQGYDRYAYSKIDYPEWRHLAETFPYAVACVLSHAKLDSFAPRDHPCATNGSSDRPFAKAVDHWEAFARNNHFAECKKCHSKSAANRVLEAARSQLWLAGMVEFSTIEYHSGRSGKFVEIWSSHKFARPPSFFQVFKHSLRERFATAHEICIEYAFWRIR